MDAQYSIRVYGIEGGDRGEWITTPDIASTVKARWLRPLKLRVKTYEQRTYLGHWPVYHEWTCPHGIVIIAHQL